jgi:hypothetical protein
MSTAVLAPAKSSEELSGWLCGGPNALAMQEQALMERSATLRSRSSVNAQPKGIDFVEFRKHICVLNTVHSCFVLSPLSRFHLLVASNR